jgi:hypothetical protein
MNPTLAKHLANSRNPSVCQVIRSIAEVYEEVSKIKIFVKLLVLTLQ